VHAHALRNVARCAAARRSTAAARVSGATLQLTTPDPRAARRQPTTMALSKLALALAVAPSAALVAPSAKVSSTKLSAEGKLDEIPEDTNRFTSRLATQEGFCLDLPGALAPMGQWDPAGFTSEASDNDIRRYREAETQHGRVAMLAVIGFLVAESWHPLFADVTGPAIDHLTQVRQEYPAFFEIGALVIGGLEVNRALVGWAFPDSREKVRAPRPLSI
jgi:hypothetical protein